LRERELSIWFLPVVDWILGKKQIKQRRKKKQIERSVWILDVEREGFQGLNLIPTSSGFDSRKNEKKKEVNKKKN